MLARASQVSTRWHDLVSDDITWKNLCVKHDYQRRLSEVQSQDPSLVRQSTSSLGSEGSLVPKGGSSTASTSGLPSSTSLAFDGSSASNPGARPQARSYKSHFKQRYLVDAAWRTGGRNTTRNITQDGGVVTSLHLTSKYIIVALDNARIHVFDTDGNPLRTLQGHVMGVWAMVPWDDILVSGGCDRDVRVWDLTTG